MRVVFLIGGIASGKSSAAKLLERRGATRIDLDQVSREVLAPGSSLLPQIAQAFGEDVLDGEGVLDRGLLAQRAFATPQATARLEALELPAITDGLLGRLDDLRSCARPPACVVVEVPLPDRMGNLRRLADEVLLVACPVALRRRRAIGRGMTGEDFDRRAARQLGDDALAALATTTFDNTGDEAALARQVNAWWDARFGA